MNGVRVCSLASGSNGNCVLVRAGVAAVLIDAGLSARAMLAGLGAAGVPESAVRAILLTHEHRDHTSGLGPISRRLRVPVIANRATLARACAPATGIATAVLATGDSMEIAGIRVGSFAVSHDAVEPVGYVLEYGGRRVGYATDTGVDLGLCAQIGGADLAIIEANHDVQRLLNGPYPRHLKQRILSDAGHLSNAGAAVLAEALLQHSPHTEIWLAHLSATNNTPQLAQAAVSRRLSDAGFHSARVSVAPRGRPGPIWDSSGFPRQLTLF